MVFLELKQIRLLPKFSTKASTMLRQFYIWDLVQRTMIRFKSVFLVTVTNDTEISVFGQMISFRCRSVVPFLIIYNYLDEFTWLL